MNAIRTLGALSIAVLMSVIASGQETLDPAKPELLPIQFQVLKAWKVELGNRSIFLNRVAPPALPAAPVKPAQLITPIGQAGVEEPLAPEKKSEVLFLSATVYDRGFTEIRWVSGEHRWTAFSNIDFNLLSGVGSFETEDTAYSLLLGLGNVATGALESSGGITLENQAPTIDRQLAKSLEQLSPTFAQYLIVGDAPGAAPLPGELSALDALHRYFDANRQRLAEGHANRETERNARQQWLNENPPVPKETVVHYWKMDAASVRAAIEDKGK